MILLSGIPIAQSTHDACQELVTQSDDATRRVLRVSLDHGPGHCLDRWADSTYEAIDDLVVLAPNGTTRSAAATGSDASPRRPDVEHVTLDDPTDIPTLGSQLTDILYRWAEDGDSVHVCFDSVTALLNAHSVETVFQFLHVLRGHLHKLGATSHFHVDSTAHDDVTISKLLSLFDSVREIEDDPLQ